MLLDSKAIRITLNINNKIKYNKMSMKLLRVKSKDFRRRN